MEKISKRTFGVARDFLSLAFPHAFMQKCSYAYACNKNFNAISIAKFYSVCCCH